MSRPLVLLVLIFVYACSQQTVDASFVGTFQLVTRDGEALPAPIVIDMNGNQCTHQVLSTVLTIDTGGTWTETVRAQVLCEAKAVWSPEPFERTGGGNVAMVGSDKGAIQLLSQELDEMDGTQVASMHGEELHMTYENVRTGKRMMFVYRRHPG